LSTNRRPQPFSLHEAAEGSPTLARLAQLTRESTARLQAILPLVPAGLRAAVRAGPIDGDQWCLLVDNNAAAAKLRQLLPALLAELRRRGCEVTSIRLKVGRACP
jgi:hypothetical protein